MASPRSPARSLPAVMAQAKSLVPFQKQSKREISLKRRTKGGTIVKDIRFTIDHKTVPRCPGRAPGAPPPSLEQCHECVPQNLTRQDCWSMLTCSWFFLSVEGDKLDHVHGQITLLAALTAVVVRGSLGDAREIEDLHVRSLCVAFCWISVLLLYCSAFFALVHTVISQKMKLYSQSAVFELLYLQGKASFLSPIKFLQYGMFSGALGGVFWVFGFLKYQWGIGLVAVALLLSTVAARGFILFIHAGISVLESEPLHTGQQVSLGWKALKTLLDAYEEDVGEEFMSPEGYFTFCGENLLKAGCRDNELCEFSHVTKLRMDAMIEKRFEDLADWQSFVEQCGGPTPLQRFQGAAKATLALPAFAGAFAHSEHLSAGRAMTDLGSPQADDSAHPGSLVKSVKNKKAKATIATVAFESHEAASSKVEKAKASQGGVLSAITPASEESSKDSRRDILSDESEKLKRKSKIPSFKPSQEDMVISAVASSTGGPQFDHFATGSPLLDNSTPPDPCWQGQDTEL